MPKTPPKYPKLPDNELIFFQSSDGKINVEVMYGEENVWISQQIMANLFGVEENTITYHIQTIYKSGELEDNSTTRKIRGVRQEGKR